MSSFKDRPGNILGNARAEADLQMLGQAFVETADYLALTKTTDFHFVVGRRGTGKSALYQRLKQFFTDASKTWIHTEIPKEHFALELQGRLKALDCDYRMARSICRLLWRSYILVAVGRQTNNHYKAQRSTTAPWLADLYNKDPYASYKDVFSYANAVLSACPSIPATQLPSEIARLSKIDQLQESVVESLVSSNSKSVVLLDNLDEGWEPAAIPTAILGGLALAATDLRDSETNIHVIVFVRDNMFRALSHFDPDFSRHIEGSSLRLAWDENSLFHLVAQRIRVALNFSTENDAKVWSRFAARGLEGRTGFEKCLQNTLYRPRDVLALLNRAYQLALRDERGEIIDEDVEKAGRTISSERLEDLLKEYNTVLPGLRLFIDIFRDGPALSPLGGILQRLNHAIESGSYETIEARDFALLGTGQEIFYALHSIGFLGIEQPGAGRFMFSHDGASSDLSDLSDNIQVAIHPCYWRALGLTMDAQPIEVLTRIHDDYEPGDVSAIKDHRSRRLGQLVEQLPRLTMGADDAAKFEEWVHRTIQILFAGHLANVELHPNKDAVHRRDVVGTNISNNGFWRRVYEVFGAHQVVFEVKNYAELKLEDMRQALAYSGDYYGNITFLVYRTESEGASEKERAWLQEIYRHKHLILLLPAKSLARCVSKQRSGVRDEYADAFLTKRLDTHLRSYLSIRHAPARKRAKKRN
jgi:Cdc6-like AAA superfamily ATPase